MTWYYASPNDRQPQGPVSWEVLRQLAQSGRIGPDALVWTEGYADWVSADTVGGLFADGGESPANSGDEVPVVQSVEFVDEHSHEEQLTPAELERLLDRRRRRAELRSRTGCLGLVLFIAVVAVALSL